MTLTKKLAIELHRKLWRWIADETERRRCFVEKIDYPPFRHIDVDVACWCCKYARQEIGSLTKKTCTKCPIKWKYGECLGRGRGKGEYKKWENATTWQEAAHWARVIAELPERDEHDE